VFAKRETRKVGGNNEISYNRETYAPVEKGHSFEARTTIEIRETFKGELIALHKGQFVQFEKIERVRRHSQNVATKNVKETRKPYKPAANHPWRKGSICGKQTQQNIIDAIAS